MQRVALARSLVYRPQLLLLDEPLSNLDAKLRIRLRDELRRILKQTGMTGLYVTHDQSEAVVLGDRIGVMRDGKLLQMAPPGEIYNRPADSFVANFTGASNVLLGKVLARRASSATIDLGAAGRIEAWTPQPLAAGDKARVALRAENVRLGERGPANVFSGRVHRAPLPGHADRLRRRVRRPAGRGARTRHRRPPRATARSPSPCRPTPAGPTATRVSRGDWRRAARSTARSAAAQRRIVLGQQHLRIERQHAARGVALREMDRRVAALQRAR